MIGACLRVNVRVEARFIVGVRVVRVVRVKVGVVVNAKVWVSLGLVVGLGTDRRTRPGNFFLGRATTHSATGELVERDTETELERRACRKRKDKDGEAFEKGGQVI